ncbi:MAG: FAD-dependent oxidoreductase [Clostridiales bacterium]|nr:FAD-dependent oxidoreductase [Clostridiales bacterium]
MTDVLIIGSGPAGLSAAIYAGRAGLDVVVLDSNAYTPGQICESGQVDNYLGFYGISGYDLSSKFLDHARKMGTVFLEGKAVKLEKTSTGWTTRIDGEKEITSKTVIFAGGAEHKRLSVKGEAEFAGRGVSYCALCDGAFFIDQDVAVVGGGNAALEDTLYLSELCRKVYLIHRREEFRGFADTVKQIREKSNIEIITPHRLTAVEGTKMAEAVVLEDGTRLAVRGVFVSVGMKPATELLRGIVQLDETGYIIADESCVTSEEGIFAAGDVRRKNLRQVVTAVADGANAAMSAAEYIKTLRL